MKQPNPTARRSDETGASSSNAPSISRRAFVGATAALGAASLGGAADLFGTYGEAQAAEAAEERTFECVCRPNCHGFCRHKVTVRDGLVVKSERASFPDSRYDRICLRGIDVYKRQGENGTRISSEYTSCPSTTPNRKHPAGNTASQALVGDTSPGSVSYTHLGTEWARRRYPK